MKMTCNNSSPGLHDDFDLLYGDTDQRLNKPGCSTGDDQLKQAQRTVRAIRAYNTKQRMMH